MRESIGGTMLFWIVLFLLSMFLIFMSFIVKYARVYKIKNSIVNYIERGEGVTSKEDFDFELLFLGYPKKGQYKLCRYIMQEKGGYFYVELFSRTEFPIVGNFLSLNIKIKGETRLIETGTRIKNTKSGNVAENNWFLSPKNECKFCTIGVENCESYEVPDEY